MHVLLVNFTIRFACDNHLIIFSTGLPEITISSLLPHHERGRIRRLLNITPARHLDEYAMNL